MRRNLSLLVICALLVGCIDQPFRPDPSTTTITPAESKPSFGFSWAYNPWGTYDEIIAESQTDEADDGVRWRCPEERVSRPWKMTLTGDALPGVNPPEYLAHFEFDDYKYYLGYVGRSDTDLPLADYRYNNSATSSDQRFRLEAYMRLTLMCRGVYIRARGLRVWSGSYWPVAHQGEVGFGPSYAPDYGDSGCGTGGGGYGDYRLEDYDPYDSGSGGAWNVMPSDGPSYDCGTTSTGEGGSGGDSGGGGGTDCYYDTVVIEISYDGGLTWETYWEGVAKICNSTEE